MEERQRKGEDTNEENIVELEDDPNNATLHRVENAVEIDNVAEDEGMEWEIDDERGDKDGNNTDANDDEANRGRKECGEDDDRREYEYEEANIDGAVDAEDDNKESSSSNSKNLDDIDDVANENRMECNKNSAVDEEDGKDKIIGDLKIGQMRMKMTKRSHLH